MKKKNPFLGKSISMETLRPYKTFIIYRSIEKNCIRLENICHLSSAQVVIFLYRLPVVCILSGFAPVLDWQLDELYDLSLLYKRFKIQLGNAGYANFIYFVIRFVSL